MNLSEILAEIPRLSYTERRELVRRIFETEEGAATLSACDSQALEHFQMLDAMKAEDEKNDVRI